MPQPSRPAVFGLTVPVLLTTGLAIASLVLGFLGLLTGRSITGGLFVILGVILGIAALIQVAKPSRLARATLYTIIGMLFLMLFLGGLLLSTERAKPSQDDKMTRSQLRIIRQTCVIWAKNNGAFPPDLGTVVAAGMLSAASFISPFDAKNQEGLIRPDYEHITDWVNRNTSFAYVTGLTNSENGDEVVAFEKLRTPRKRFISIVFNDGHAQSWPTDEARQIIFEQTGRTLEEWSKDR